MTGRDATELRRLAAELATTITGAGELAAQLAPWARQDASADLVLIPAALLHHFYTAVESALSRLAIAFEGSEPHGADGHRRLLALSSVEVPGVRPAWIGQEELDALRELLGFRHLFRHGDAATYRPGRLRELASLAVAVWPAIDRQLRAAHALMERSATSS